MLQKDRQTRSALEGEKPYQVVLTDMHMPGMDGFGLVTEIRTHTAMASLPVLILSSGDAAKMRSSAVSWASLPCSPSRFGEESC